ncbi:MAG: AbrB/MazE/SpoVT family DNA-binding domain-containing protein [Planctomycetota bacterium]
MSALTVKGQVTIPKAIRDRLELQPGDQVDFVAVDDHIEVRKVREDLTPYEAGKHLFGRHGSGDAATYDRAARKAMVADAIEDKHAGRSR